MTEPFDEHIRKYRAAFDTEEPPMEMWERIATKANITEPTTRKTAGLQWIKYAATAAIVVSTGIGAWFYSGINRSSAPVESVYDAQLTEAARYYETEIDQKQRLVLQLTASQPAVSEGITRDMAQLDSSLVQLKRDLGDGVANTELVEAMIQSYRLKLSILEEVLGYLKANDEPSDKKQNVHEL